MNVFDVLLRLRMISQGDLDAAILTANRTHCSTEQVLVESGKLPPTALQEARRVLQDIERRPVKGRAELVARQYDALKLALS